LHYLYNDESFPAIKYINNDWFYLSWNLRKYYTNPLSQITTPLSFRLGTYQTLLVEVLSVLRELMEASSDSGDLRKVENVLNSERESACA